LLDETVLDPALDYLGERADKLLKRPPFMPLVTNQDHSRRLNPQAILEGLPADPKYDPNFSGATVICDAIGLRVHGSERDIVKKRRAHFFLAVGSGPLTSALKEEQGLLFTYIGTDDPSPTKTFELPFASIRGFGTRLEELEQGVAERLPEAITLSPLLPTTPEVREAAIQMS
jgi:hypothetical protein